MNPVFKRSKIVLTFFPSYKIVFMKMNISKDITLEISVTASERKQFVLISFMNANKVPLVSNYTS